MNSVDRLVADARDFAIKAHGTQPYGPHPYSYHLDAVANIVMPYGELAGAVAYLHDVLEDTPVTADVLAGRFGHRITLYVQLCSDEPGKTRRERKQATNLKLKHAIESCHLALIVKAADRLANVRECLKTGDSKLEMYRKEHEAFMVAAARPGLCDGIWQELIQYFKPGDKDGST